MNTTYKGIEKCVVTPNRKSESEVFEKASIAFHGLRPEAALELHAPDGGWLKGTDDANSIIVPQDVVALRFNSAEELRELARLCEHMATRLEFMERAQHVAKGGCVSLVCKHSVGGTPGPVMAIEVDTLGSPARLEAIANALPGQLNP